MNIELETVINDLSPKETLHISNLNDKIKPEEMKICLYLLFCPFGDVIDLVCKKGLRGQAFIVFKSTVNATQARAELNNYVIFKKPLRITFSRERSDALAIHEGMWNINEIKERRAKKFEDRIEKKRKVDIPSESKTTIDSIEKKLDQEATNILMLKDLPDVINEIMLITLFSQYPGYREVRHIPERGIAFVEYEETEQASIALVGLNDFPLSKEIRLNVSYAKM